MSHLIYIYAVRKFSYFRLQLENFGILYEGTATVYFVSCKVQYDSSKILSISHLRGTDILQGEVTPP